MACIIKITTKAKDLTKTLKVLVEAQKAGLLPNELAKWKDKKHLS